MNGVFYIGATGLRTQEEALNVVANNVANVNTLGFKRSEASFTELVTAPADDDALRPIDQNGVSRLGGARVDGSRKVFSQGELRQTGKPLDIAINGEGFIELMGPGGKTLLWRGGTLKVNAEGLLTGPNDLPLKAMISVPTDATSMAIGADGRISATMADGQTTSLGQIELVMPKDMAALSPLDGELYSVADETQVTPTAPGEEGSGLLVQGSLETSNVQLSDEMVLLLLMQRAYAANAQVVQAGDQLMAIANGLKR